MHILKHKRIGLNIPVKLYRITNWGSLFENNRTRELKKLDWVPVPNKHDGDGYALVMEQPDGPALIGAWLAILQVASKCDERGTLMRDTKIPHDPASIARQSRFPRDVIERALAFFSSREMQWLKYTDYSLDVQIPQEGAKIPQEGALSDGGCSQEGITEGKGREGKGKKGTLAPRARVRDLVIDQIAMLEVSDLKEVTPTAWSRYAKVKADILSAAPDVTPEEIKRRFAAYVAKYPGAAKTATALASRWAEFPATAKPNGHNIAVWGETA